MAYRVERESDDSQCRWKSRGGNETQATRKVPIIALSKVLLGKGKGAKILDTRRNSGMVVKLVEELG